MHKILAVGMFCLLSTLTTLFGVEDEKWKQVEKHLTEFTEVIN